jgi:hypothetical protein
MKTATIVLPSGYATAEEFAKDCGFELPAVPALGTPVAWQCIDERREFRYIKGIVSVDKETVEAWKDVGIAFVGLGRIDVPAQGTPASRWREKGEIDPHGTRYDCERASTAGGHLTDDEVANAVFLDPSIQNLTIAKDRIRWLSRKLAEALAERAAATVCHDCGTDDPCGENCPNWIATKTEVALVTCPKCGGSGFSGRGSGYDDVCDECGGCKEVPASWRSPAVNDTSAAIAGSRGAGGIQGSLQEMAPDLAERMRDEARRRSQPGSATEEPRG